jgi:hypothetical protein
MRLTLPDAVRCDVLSQSGVRNARITAQAASIAGPPILSTLTSKGLTRCLLGGLRSVTYLPQLLTVERHIGTADGLCGADAALCQFDIDEVT